MYSIIEASKNMYEIHERGIILGWITWNTLEIGLLLDKVDISLENESIYRPTRIYIFIQVWHLHTIISGKVQNFGALQPEARGPHVAHEAICAAR